MNNSKIQSTAATDGRREGMAPALSLALAKTCKAFGPEPLAPPGNTEKPKKLGLGL